MMVMMMVAVAAIGMRMRTRTGMAMSMVMAMGPIVAVVMGMIMAVRMVWRTRLDGGLRIAAAAYCTHQAISSSLTRISSPAVICS